MSGAEQGSDLDFARAVPEIHRTRARSAAALVSTAAGAIAAGILFSPFARDLTIYAVIAAIVALVALVIGVAFYLSASVFFLDEGSSGSRLWRTLWRQKASAKTGSTLDADDVDEVISHIAQRTGWGSVFSVIGALSFVVALVLGVTSPRYDHVTVELLGAATWDTSEICPDLPQVFDGEVLHSELVAQGPLVPVVVTASVCTTSSRGEVVVLIDRALANFVVG